MDGLNRLVWFVGLVCFFVVYLVAIMCLNDLERSTWWVVLLFLVGCFCFGWVASVQIRFF